MSTFRIAAALGATFLLFNWLSRREGRLQQEAITEAETFDPSDPTILETAIAAGSTTAEASSNVYGDVTNAIGNVFDFLTRPVVVQSQDLDTGSSPQTSQTDAEALLAQAEAQQTTLQNIIAGGWTEEGGLPSDYVGGL